MLQLFCCFFLFLDESGKMVRTSSSALLNRTLHLPTHEHIRTFALTNIHYLYNILLLKHLSSYMHLVKKIQILFIDQLARSKAACPFNFCPKLHFFHLFPTNFVFQVSTSLWITDQLTIHIEKQCNESSGCVFYICRRAAQYAASLFMPFMNANYIESHMVIINSHQWPITAFGILVSLDFGPCTVCCL